MTRVLRGLLFCLAASMCVAASSEDRQTLVAGSGLQVQLAWSADWVEEKNSQMPPTTVAFRSKTAGAMVAYITPEPEQKGEKASDAGMREVMRVSINALSAQSLEQELVAKPLEGGKHSGFFVRATDKAPKPGEFKYLETMIVAVGDVPVLATVLFNDSGAADAVRARNAIASLELPSP